MEVKNVPIDKVVPYANNPRQNEEAVAKVAASIKEFGWRQPIVVDKDMVIIVGHTRLKAAQKLGLKEVPINVASELTPAQVKAYRIADNRVGEEAEWDMEKLRVELESLETDSDLDIALLGFDADELDKIRIDPDELDAEPDEEAENIPEEVETRCAKGDLWQLGDHLLLCGDSTDLNNYKILLGDEKIALTITDPPYNVDYTGKTKDALKIENDKMKDGEFADFLKRLYGCLHDYHGEGCPIYVFHADSEGHNFRKEMIDAGFKLAQCLVWVKNNMVMGRQDYHWQHEPCLYGWKEGAAHKWYHDRKQTTLLQFDRPSRNAEHPTMKPVDMICYLMKNSSKKKDIVFDSFLGSGTTLIASEKMGRHCRGMELDPHYCDVILTRWEEYTGKQAVKVNSTKGKK